MKSVLWRVVKRLSYIEDARCLKVKSSTYREVGGTMHRFEDNIEMYIKLNKIGFSR